MFSRKREQEPTPAPTPRKPDAPTLVSMGESMYTQKNRHSGKWEQIPCELFCDKAHPMRRYVRFDGSPALHPLHSTSGGENRVERFTVSQSRMDVSAFEPAGPSSPPVSLGSLPGKRWGRSSAESASGAPHSPRSTPW